MNNVLIYPIGTTKACHYAASFLNSAGISLIDHPSPEVTHLLLDAPSFFSPGVLRGGEDFHRILSMLPKEIRVIGGALNDPSLATYFTLDVLKDPIYLAVNAAITADCALQVAAPLLKTTFTDSPVLIIGWGRIGKCLGKILLAIGCNVTIAARKECDRAMLQALGYQSVDITEIPLVLPKIRLLFNTVPEMLLPAASAKSSEKCIKIDLASKPGIEGSDVVIARGLPGVYAPESSGKLIADTILRLI